MAVPAFGPALASSGLRPRPWRVQSKTGSTRISWWKSAVSVPC